MIIVQNCTSLPLCNFLRWTNHDWTDFSVISRKMNFGYWETSQELPFSKWQLTAVLCIFDRMSPPVCKSKMSTAICCMARDAFWGLLACSMAILLAKSYPIQLGPDLMRGEELLKRWGRGGGGGRRCNAMLGMGGEELVARQGSAQGANPSHLHC